MQPRRSPRRRPRPVEMIACGDPSGWEVRHLEDALDSSGLRIIGDALSDCAGALSPVRVGGARLPCPPRCRTANRAGVRGCPGRMGCAYRERSYDRRPRTAVSPFPYTLTASTVRAAGSWGDRDPVVVGGGKCEEFHGATVCSRAAAVVGAGGQFSVHPGMYAARRAKGTRADDLSGGIPHDGDHECFHRFPHVPPSPRCLRRGDRHRRRPPARRDRLLIG